MKKYAVGYNEHYAKTFVVEADSEGEAIEKMEHAAMYIGLNVGVDDFQQWEIGGVREISENDAKCLEKLPEE